DRELRDAREVVVLPVREPRDGERLPVRRRDDQRAQQHERGDREARHLLVHASPRTVFARFESSISPASRMKFATTLEPPYETNGIVMPVSGMRPTMPPTMMNACSAKPNVSPTASSFEKPSSVSSAMRKPRATKSM